ncbi:hypothetical protein O9X98_14520 [Agrobacterium salinitolerans]|nr:hypothetical protein [Agrobacterium salinitolerans]
MKNRDTPISPTAEGPFKLDSFWTPPSADVIRADVDEFARQFGLMPELAEALGLRRYLREDTLKDVN